MHTAKPLAGHRLLLTNDDGIDAPGLAVLEDIANALCDDVWVVAPDSEKSGAGHSISLHTPIRLRLRGERRWAVQGTPTDCVLMAFHELMTAQRPTVVLSGVNNGANLAEDISYSGTCAAAMEGTLLGLRSVALSMLRGPDGSARWEAARQHLPSLLAGLLRQDHWPDGSFININLPDATPAEISGVRVTRQGRRPPGAFSIDPRLDGRNQPYFWVKIAYPEGGRTPGTDLHAIEERAISVTPVQLDFTNEAWRGRLAEALRG